jgi:LEA14-like dessication related protein
MPNTKKILRWSGFIAGISMLSYGIYKYYMGQIEKAFQYCYKISNIKMRKLSKELISFDLFVKVLNRSNFDATVTHYNFDIIVQGKQVVNLKQENPFYVKANGVTEIDVLINFEPKIKYTLAEAIDLILKGTTDKKNFIIEVKGSMGANIDFIKIKELPIDMKFTLEEILAPSNEGDANLKCDIK